MRTFDQQDKISDNDPKIIENDGRGRYDGRELRGRNGSVVQQYDDGVYFHHHTVIP